MKILRLPLKYCIAEVLIIGLAALPLRGFRDTADQYDQFLAVAGCVLYYPQLYVLFLFITDRMLCATR
jgi:hypothetical protein